MTWTSWVIKKKKNCVDDVPVKFKYQYGIGLWLFPLIFAELVFVNSPSSWTTQIWSYQYCTQINQANGNRARIWLVWELVRGRYKKGVDLTGQICLARIENEIGWHASFFVFFIDIRISKAACVHMLSYKSQYSNPSPIKKTKKSK